MDGTSTDWPAAATRDTHNVDEWLTLIAAGQAIGLTSAATTWQHPRPGIVYQPVRDAPRVPVWLAWWRDGEPACAASLVLLVCELYARSDWGRHGGR